MAFPHGLRALNHSDFRRFYFSQFAAQIGSWMQNVAQAWLVLQLTNSPFKLGLLATLQFSPVLLFSIVSGAVADRLPKRPLLVATQTTLACQGLLLALLVATGHVEYWHVAVLGLALGFANVVDQPARQSFVMELVGRADVSSAVALNSAGFNLARIVGPAVAGVVIGRLGVAPTFFVNSLGFLGVIVTLLRMKVPEPPPRTARATIFEEIAEGVRYAAATPRLRLAMGLVFVVSLCIFNFSVYVPLLAKNVLGLGAEGFGFLMASLGVGAVAGALTVGARASRYPSLRSMFAAATLSFGMLLGLGLTRRIEFAVPLLFFTGYWGIMLMASCNTSIQLQAPDVMRGRVMSLYTWVSGGVFPIGAFIVGTISQWWGVSAAFLWNGTVGLAALGALALWWRFRRD
ncbi:MAG: MFS transporter [Candidatus Rokuibacteriota bacterium]|nr:MAG: MFS transporter [Candidatus Rokubacteria bacterium]